ncbi:hypothetical protein EDB83DRAFT_361867 [Lactarius deliciosus]|nr:hypothetical protein EDB83DRAFT_361867 [Lactarius deliciosus]
MSNVPAPHTSADLAFPAPNHPQLLCCVPTFFTIRLLLTTRLKCPMFSTFCHWPSHVHPAVGHLLPLAILRLIKHHLVRPFIAFPAIGFHRLFFIISYRIPFATSSNADRHSLLAIRRTRLAISLFAASLLFCYSFNAICPFASCCQCYLGHALILRLTPLAM